MGQNGTSEEALGGLITLALYIGLPLILLLGTCIVNCLIRRSRNKYLAEQELYFSRRIRMTNLKRFPQGSCHDPVLVTGIAVVANNYFVSALANFKHIFGGELKGYTELCAAARRLALVRMLQEADKMGANVIYNLRFETSNILSANNKQKTAGGVELIAYGTAVKEDNAV